MQTTADIAEAKANMRKLVFAREMSVSEFAFQCALLDGRVKSRDEYLAGIRAEAGRQADFERAMCAGRC